MVYYGIQLDHYSYTWGGNTYNKLLTQDYPSEDLISTTSTQDTTANFLYPKLVGNPAYIDGIAEGHITVSNTHAADAMTISSYTVTLKKTDNVPSNETTLGAWANDISAGDNIVSAASYLTLPVYIDITKKKIDIDEKLIFCIEVTATGGTLNIEHYNGSDPDDIKIKIPYSPVG